jgi:sulfur-oxidizing protein SoxX
VVYPADGKFLGNWKEGAKIANNGRGGQFSDPPDTVAGGNCYACHQMEQKEVSYGTLGPSLTNYGKDRKYDPQEIKNAFTKVYDSQAMFACSNMPRFGVNKVLSEQQIKDIVAFLFDPESPVNK